LHDIATGKGFSPSSIGSYLRSPLGFYKQRVLGINDIDEVEENIAANTLGTIIHNVLEELYKPYVNKFLSEPAIDSMLDLYKLQVDKQFREVYKKGEIKKGKNLIAYKVAETYITNFLELEKQAIRNGDAIQILSLEETQEVIITHDLLPYPVKISGKVDRIELRNGTYRIIDYKSGAVSPTDVRVKNWEALIADDKKSKAIQLLCYALMIADKYQDRELEVGLISFKNLKNGFIAFEDTDLKQTLVNQDILSKFKEQLVLLLAEILNPEIPFTVDRKNP
jgi:ATP-dependent exoDNAse (exonuclease V) beta subunit